MEAYTGHDRIALYLSGGATNQSPSLSLGGLISSRLVKGMAPQYTTPVQGLIIEDATPENGPGLASVAITSGVAVYTPPDGIAGVGVAIGAGERKILTGLDVTKAIRVYRPTGLTFDGTATFKLVDAVNGVLAMANVPDAVRSAGGMNYRAFFIKALADATGIKLWVTTDGQAAFALAEETPSADTIQTIADDTTAPTAVSWVNAVSEGTALDVGALSAGDTMGIWLRRTFPSSGTYAIEETVSLHLKHSGL